VVRVALAFVALSVDSQLEVHHLYPHDNGGGVKSLADVTVLCANCYRLAHLANAIPLTLDQLKALNATAVDGVA
jgi:predicted HNH restriction endonuclease